MTRPAVPDVLPPEWALQSAVMLTWPRDGGDFGPLYAAVERNFIAIATVIAHYQNVHINVATGAAGLRERLLNAGIQPERLRIFELPNDDVWARDHGPLTILRNGASVHLDFTFNGWGSKFSSQRDNRITRRLAALGAWDAPVETVDFVLEGGAIEVDGNGSLMTTERCLLAPTRNPQMNRAGIEAVLRQRFGVSRIHWLRHGDLQGDDTDGHVDTIARFCNPGTIAYQACDDRADAQFENLAALVDELVALRNIHGRPYTLIPLPLPAAIFDTGDRHLPAGYANFLIINDAVLVPTYGDACDEIALDRLRGAFPGREIIGIDCRALIQQYGSLHCVTMQIPAATAL